jgi:hypothetical protein
MVNPNPALITEEMWRLWTDRPNLAWRLSGIYANKKGYHNTVNANLRNWPGNYSIRLALDLTGKNRDKARAIDLTMTEEEMVKWTRRMRDSALNAEDNRLGAVREFYGTLDGKNVFGLSKTEVDGQWHSVTADSTHLWHGHTSIFTSFVANWIMLAPILSVWAGEPFADWKDKAMDYLPRKDQSSEAVKYWQCVHNDVRNSVKPPCDRIDTDGSYGAATAAAFADFYKKVVGPSVYDGSYLSGWLAMQYHKRLVPVTVLPVIPTIDPEVVKDLVNTWLEAHVPGNLVVNGDFSGKVTIP